MTESMFITMVVGIVGLMMGSFFNVCVHRIPLHQSVVTPGSHCPKCQHSIAWYDNIPVLSWLLLKAKCRHCASPISWRYPFLEAAVGVSWALIASHYGLSLLLAQALIFVSLLWVLSLIDLETGLLPDVLTYPGMIIGLMFAAWLSYLPDAVIGCVAGYGIFWIVNFLFKLITGQEGMGHGDFKLMAMLGAFMGWQALPFIVFASSIIGALVGGIWMLASRQERRVEIPFGPYLALAGVVWFFWSAEVLHAYFSWLGIAPV